MSTLFELSDEISNIEYVLENADEENEDIVAVIDEYLAGIRGDLKIKLDNYAGLIRELEARSAVRKEEADRLTRKAETDANKVASLKECLRWYLLTHNMQTKPIETPRFRITLAQNGGKRPIFLSIPVEDLPPDYVLQTTIYKADMEAIRQALENGTEIFGVALGERGCNLRIM